MTVQPHMPNFTQAELAMLDRTDFVPIHFTVDIRGHRASVETSHEDAPPEDQFEPFVQPEFTRLIATNSTAPDRPTRLVLETYGNDVMTVVKLLRALANNLEAQPTNA